MAELLIEFDKLQHIDDLHARDFGCVGKKNAGQLKRLEGALSSHVQDAEAMLIRGKYRGQDADLYCNPRSQHVVVAEETGNVIAAFKASVAQAEYIESTGRLNR